MLTTLTESQAASTMARAQRSHDRQPPPDAKPVEFTLTDWDQHAPDAFNAALAEVFADEAGDLYDNRYPSGHPYAGMTNIERVVERMETKLAHMEHSSIAPPSWMGELRSRRASGDEE